MVSTESLRRAAEWVQDEGAKKALMDSAFQTERLSGYRVARQAFTLANIAGVKRRTVYDSGEQQSLPPTGSLVRGEGDPAVADAAVNEAYDNAGTAYDFYEAIFGRNSVDGRGMRLDLFVHYGTNFANARWDGSEVLFGDGDGVLYTGFAAAPDLVAHELTHGVTQNAVPGGLVYQGQSGGLNESISDVFGSMAKQWRNNQTVDQADWLMGVGIVVPQFGQALRSMADPGNRDLTYLFDDQIAKMSDYRDDIDIHDTSGIANHAFYLAATAFGGYSWDKAGKIWYAALPMLTPNAKFADAAAATITAAKNLFGQAEADVVANAWTQVEVI
jgi:Zn-dependent metalloprotease